MEKIVNGVKYVKYTRFKSNTSRSSPYPDGVCSEDIVDVIITDGGPIRGTANEFGWNETDIHSFRKVA